MTSLMWNQRKCTWTEHTHISYRHNIKKKMYWITILISSKPAQGAFNHVHDFCCHRCTQITWTMAGLCCCSNGNKEHIISSAAHKKDAERLSLYGNESWVVSLPAPRCELHGWQDIPRAPPTHKSDSQHNAQFGKRPWRVKGAPGESPPLKNKRKMLIYAE